MRSHQVCPHLVFWCQYIVPDHIIRNQHTILHKVLASPENIGNHVNRFKASRFLRLVECEIINGALNPLKQCNNASLV